MDDITSVITRGPGPATLDLAPPGLCGQPPPLRPSGRFRGPTRRGRRCQRLAQQRGHPLTCSTAVASLRTVLRRVDGEGGTHETGRQARRPLALTVGQRARGGEVEGELDARIGRVDPLTAGSAGPTEPLDEIGRGDDGSCRDPRPGRYVQVTHPTRISLSPCGPPATGGHEALARRLHRQVTLELTHERAHGRRLSTRPTSATVARQTAVATRRASPPRWPAVQATTRPKAAAPSEPRTTPPRRSCTARAPRCR